MSLTGERILITGASGSLGKQLLHDMTGRGIEPVTQVREGSDTAYIDSLSLEKRTADIRDPDTLRNLVKGVDAVIHTAAWVNFRRDRASDFSAINVQGAVSLYQAARDAGVRRFVQVSTVAAVGARPRKSGQPLASLRGTDAVTEEMPFNLEHLRIPYINTKREAEASLLKEAAQGGPELVIVNPSVIVAPSRTGDDRSKARRSLRHPVAPNLPNLVNLVDIRDVAPGVVAALEKGRPGERYILGGDNISGKDLVLVISSIVGVWPHLIRVPRSLMNGLSRFSSFWGDLFGGKVSFYPGIVRMLDYDWAYSSMKARRELGYTNRSLDVTLNDLLTNSMTGTWQKPA